MAGPMRIPAVDDAMRTNKTNKPFWLMYIRQTKRERQRCQRRLRSAQTYPNVVVELKSDRYDRRQVGIIMIVMIMVL